MKKIKCAVIGVGYLGKFHAQKYAALSNAELIAVCDVDPHTCNEVAQSLKVTGVSDYRDLLGKVDAVSIVVPTLLHFEVAKAFLEHNTHVLIEKPITTTVDEANQLIALAKKHQVTLQVGHLERFNSARLAVENYLTNPRFIESQRLAPFNPRGADVNVILDLMIHDIDIIHYMVKSPIKTIDAQGAPILSKDIDIANARIHFENGCVANVTASRISFKSVRKARIFQPESYISIDFQDKKFAVFHKGEGEMFPGIPTVDREEFTFEKGDALLLEIASFITAIINNTPPLVTGEDGRDALATAEQITTLIQENIAKQKTATF